MHNIYSIETKKRGLCAFDDKRILLDDEINTLAYGHYKATGEIKEILVEVPVIQNSQKFATSADPEENFPAGRDPSKISVDELVSWLEEGVDEEDFNDDL